MKQSEKIKQVKQQAKRVSDRMKKMGFDVSPRQALEVVAAERGFATWAAYEASLRKPEPTVPHWKQSDGPMSNEQYCKALEKEHVCPCCGSDQIEGAYVDIDDEFADQKCGCLECNSEWYDYYRIHHYVLVSNGLLESSDHEVDQEDEGEKSATNSGTRTIPLVEPYVDLYTLAVYEQKTHSFIAKATLFAMSEAEAQETMRIRHARNYSPEELTFYIELSAKARVSVDFFVERLVSKVPEGFLDELVIDTVQEKGLPALNAEVDHSRQGILLGDAEVAASRINNDGFAAQVKYLLQMMSAGDFLNYVSQEAEVPPNSLFH